DDLVRVRLHLVARVTRSDRSGENEPSGAAAPDGFGRRTHRGAGREPIVDQDHRASFDRGERPAAAVETVPALELPELAGDLLPEGVAVDSELAGDLVVDDEGATGRDRADGELGLARSADLADDEDIQRSPQDAGDLGRDRDAAARQAEHEDVGPPGIS